MPNGFLTYISVWTKEWKLLDFRERCRMAFSLTRRSTMVLREVKKMTNRCKNGENSIFSPFLCYCYLLNMVACFLSFETAPMFLCLYRQSEYGCKNTTVLQPYFFSPIKSSSLAKLFYCKNDQNIKKSTKINFTN